MLYGGGSPRSTLRVSLVLIYVRKNAPVSARGCECTCACMRGNTSDVQIHLCFSSWNIAMLSGKSGETAATLKSCLIDICLQEFKGKGAKVVDN